MNDTSDNWPVNRLAVVQIVIPTAELEHVGNHSYPYECALFILLLPARRSEAFRQHRPNQINLNYCYLFALKRRPKKIYARLRTYVIYIYI